MTTNIKTATCMVMLFTTGLFFASCSNGKKSDDVKDVATGYECGIGLTNYNDIKEGDIIEAYIIKEVERK